jgi:O-succinylbenzoic acid--CoA ligase
VHLLVPWAVAGRSAADLVRALASALSGSGPALAPHGSTGGLVGLPAQVPDGVAAVVATSGSTGNPRGVMLDAAALLASARATHDRLGGPGRWLLALPTDHVAGLQVLVRSVLAGVEPVTADPRDVRAVAAAAREGQARYAALVPTQLHRVVAATDGARHRGALPAELAALADLDAILVGGAATPPALLERGRDLGLRLVTTYGSTETSGGCVYDGVPLPGVEVALDDSVVLVTGPTLARGYVDGDPGDFEDRDGRRWFRTADLGRLAQDGRLEVLGRRDDALVVGGTTVWPQDVERVLAELPEVGEVCVVGLPDERWGQVPVALVVPGSGPLDLERARAVVVRTLGSAAAPRRLVAAARLPLRGPGKVDRAAAARLARAGSDEED